VTFLDANILLDIALPQSEWFEWSATRMRERARAGPLLINDVVYAETSVSFATPERLDAFLGLVGVTLERSPKEALFLAARAHLSYRRQGGTRLGVLPDFFIGAHALHSAAPLLTRDPRRYRTYFPELMLISP
jgi:predicted nucleic acid-binding protein